MKYLTFIGLILVSTIAFVACLSDDAVNEDPNATIASCEGCHRDYQTLVKVYTPDTSAAGGGCSGEVTHIEPYDRVYLSDPGFSEFKKSTHGKMACTECHNGVGNTSDKNTAHSGTFVAHPSTIRDEKCGQCHAEDIAANKDNMHNGWGQKRKVTVRSGLAGAHEFHLLPAKQQEGYNSNCATCHASNCGDCHINRPKAGGGGLLNGHMFSKTPNMIDVCVTCHKTRGGHAFLGVASGTQPDVHQTKGYTCITCHDKSEVHGDGTKYEQRYKVAMLPKCTDCHSGLENKNTYHSMHYNTFSCNTCHSQDYNTCGSCHIGGEGARITAHLEFKIAMNPIPDIKKGYKYALVRRNPAAPDNFSVYGVPSYANFDAFPTYNYTTPHNILRWTTRTKVENGGKCSDNCHISKDGDVYKNKNLYLFYSELYQWEINATKGITVDGKLPSNWGVQ